MIYVLIVSGILLCAIQAIRTTRLLGSALWLAGTSALVALLLYMLGAIQVAVIELSVGAGLVTILFVFAINLVGEEEKDETTSLPIPLILAVVFAVMILLGLLNLPALSAPFQGPQQASHINITLWEQRPLDLLLQVVLIFAGVLGVINLISEDHTAPASQKQETHKETRS